MKNAGNMTSVEKQMNKDDLSAWKNYDQNQYSLIPGVQNKKNIPERFKSSDRRMDDEVNKPLIDNKYDQKADRLKAYGFNANNQNGTTRFSNSKMNNHHDLGNTGNLTGVNDLTQSFDNGIDGGYQNQPTVNNMAPMAIGGSQPLGRSFRTNVFN